MCLVRLNWLAQPLGSLKSNGILFGQVTGNDTSRWDLAALTCSQGIEQVHVNVTYKGDPALGQTEEQHEPQVARDKAWRWQNNTESEAFGYELKPFFEADLAPFTGNETEEYYDSSFSHLLLRPDGSKREDLAGYDNVNNLARAVERDYSEYMRHVIDLNFRASKHATQGELPSASGKASSSSCAKPSSANTETTGTASEHVTRLAIHSTSKLILQILLAVMAAFGLASYLLVKLNGTLPRNPCNIASTMSFLAGSQLCDPNSGIIPRGAEFMSDRQLKQAFNEWAFSLGWWQTEGTSANGSNGAGDRVSTSGKSPVTATSVAEITSARFGVDVGYANVSKF
ncbi:hypothetical protein FSARC_14001 [Fusarium sarcochroum]|uniref:Uncharacterized protein n=1 Tax=Fusarium sarcochroum TaxID=1208366 RepID=A0A8H4SX46_9HYPO|nr:hypothetical protein FSARC_14001 [Fusarium sarcochroum]